MRWRVYYSALLFLLALFACSCASDSSNSGNKNTNPPPGNVTWPPEVSYLEVTPERVLDLSYAGPITLTFTFSASASHAEVVIPEDVVIPLTRINDYVWTHDFSSEQLLRTYTEGEPRVQVGACNYYGNENQQIQYNLMIPVRSNVMLDPRITPLDSDMQMSDHVLNIRHDTIYLATMLTGDFIWRKSKEVFKTTLSPRDIYAVVGQVQAYANRSAGGDEMSFPNVAIFDLASKGAIHELGHCLGLVNTHHPLLNGWGHWLPGNAANAIMGWSTPQIQEGLDFWFRLEQENASRTTKLISLPPGTEFNELELYKLGLLSRNRVSPVLQFSDPDKAVQMIQHYSSLPSCGENCRMTGLASEYVTIDDIINKDGEAAPATKTDYSIGTVVLSHGRLLTPNELAYFEHMAARGEGTMPV